MNNYKLIENLSLGGPFARWYDPQGQVGEISHEGLLVFLYVRLKYDIPVHDRGYPVRIDFSSVDRSSEPG